MDNALALTAGSIAIALVILIAWMEARTRTRIIEDEARANRRQIVTSRSFRRGGAK